MAEFQEQLVVCPKCGHKWIAKLIEGKIYYQCSTCRFQFKLVKVAA